MSYEKISPPFTTDFPDEWYALNQADHFWFAWRLRVLQQLLSARAAAAQGPLRALDVGCGIGFLRSQIEGITPWIIDGVDLNEPALQKVLPSRGRTLLYNIEDRSKALKEQYDAVILFDVVEHIDDPAKFLAAALWHLKPGGRVIINVPALQSLYSRYDQLVGHFRRYDRRSLRQLLENPAVGLKPVDMRYWGFSLVPIAGLRKLALRKSRTPEEAVAIGFNSPARWINQLFRVAMHIETGILQHPWVGSSLMALAYKPALVKTNSESGI